MGRIAGVSAADTKARLLAAAAEVFAAQGYAGTRVSDIASAAAVSNSALYAHFDSKAELLVAALQAHGRQRLAGMFTSNPNRSMAELLVELGSGLPRHQDARGSLVVQALVAARRDPDVAALMRTHLDERVRWLSDMVQIAQADDELTSDLSPKAVAQFSMLLALGSALAPADLIDVDRDEWSALIHRLVTAMAPAVPNHTETPTTEGRTPVKVSIDTNRCQGHGRCYDLAPKVFREDDEGYGEVLNDGAVPAGAEKDAQLAQANCPEHAVVIDEA